MKKTMMAVAALSALTANAAWADDLDASSTHVTTQQDSNGNYQGTVTRNHTDAYGNTATIQNHVSTDAYGNAQVSKKIERDAADGFGDSSHVMATKTINSDGVTTKTYQEQQNINQ